MAIGPAGFVALIFVLGFFMSLGKAAVYKHIPVYYPDNVGAVGGVVGMIGGLGGFLLPMTFGMLNDLTGIWTSCFMLLFVVAMIALLWMHFAIQRIERKILHGLAAIAHHLPELPHPAPRLLTEWEPEDANFWETSGKRLARRNLWISIPALLLSFAVWMVWWVVVAKLPGVGFNFTNESVVLAGGDAGAVRARPCGFSIPSWCRSSAAGSGPRWQPARC